MSIKLAVAACLALAGLSLLLPGAPSYDPLSWVVWGREIVELDLKTSGGPSWKPLPVAFTTLFSLTGGAAPWLWLLVARASALLGLVFAYRIGARLAGAAAGVLAVLALVASRGWFWSDWIGYSEGLLLALVLWAVDRHLEGRRRQALVLGFLAALLRPEVWPFVAAYATWLAVREPATRRLSALLALAVPVLWLGPELIGSGDAFRASDRARELTAGSNVPGLAHPALAVLSDGRTALLFPALVGFALALANWRPRPGVERVTLALGLGTLAWLGVVAAMAQAGYSGNPRYLIAPIGVACVLAGVGLASAGRALFSRLRVPAGLIGAATVVGVVAASLPWTLERAEALRAAAPGVTHEARLQETLPDAVRLAGGRRRLLACSGAPVTQLYAVPRVAWSMHVHVGDVGFVSPRSGVVFQARRRVGAPWLPAVGGGYRELAQTGPWRVEASCLRGRSLP